MKANTAIISLLILTLGALLFFSSQQSNGYNIDDSKRYASYAAVAFCPKDAVEAWSCGTTSKYPKLANVTYVENERTKAVSYIGYNPVEKEMVISWRGSCNIENWIEDFNFEMQPYSKCKGCFIHTGFMEDYRLNERKLLIAAKNIMANYRVDKIVCTGHSLGAALSIISGMELSQIYG